MVSSWRPWYISILEMPSAKPLTPARPTSLSSLSLMCLHSSLLSPTALVTISHLMPIFFLPVSTFFYPQCSIPSSMAWRQRIYKSRWPNACVEDIHRLYILITYLRVSEQWGQLHIPLPNHPRSSCISRWTLETMKKCVLNVLAYMKNKYDCIFIDL